MEPINPLEFKHLKLKLELTQEIKRSDEYIFGIVRKVANDFRSELQKCKPQNISEQDIKEITIPYELYKRILDFSINMDPSKNYSLDKIDTQIERHLKDSSKNEEFLKRLNF